MKRDILREFNELVRDVTQVMPRTKSEVRRRLNDLLELKSEQIKKLITDEIVVAQKEGQPTSRLTSLYNKFHDL